MSQADTIAEFGHYNELGLIGEDEGPKTNGDEEDEMADSLYAEDPYAI